jgi:hypothetical protein
VVAQLERARQVALDLPVDEVGDVQVVDCARFAGKTDDELRETPGGMDYMCATRGVTLPWSVKVLRMGKGSSCRRQKTVQVMPTEMAFFVVEPSPGCDSLIFGLSRYPATIDVEYDPEEDAKYLENFAGKGRSPDWAFSYQKFYKHHPRGTWPSSLRETRTLKTGSSGWCGHDFCKTQFASNPEYGGVANFLRGHIALITFLDRAAAIPGLGVSYDDEGKYGRSYYTDDWRAPEPVYTWHEGKYSPVALAEEVGSWNEMLAGLAGTLRDAFGDDVGSPILSRPDFERLEFRGANDPDIKPFLEALRTVTAREVLA